MADGITHLKDLRPDPRNARKHTPRNVGSIVSALHARLYNEAALVTAVGSLPIRVSGQFEASRKLGKTHQNVLVFCKGDWRAAVEACGPCEYGAEEAEAMLT